MAAEQLPAGVVSAWFGPSQPLTPVSGYGTLPRAFDYTTATNLNYQPRKDALLTFDTLRAMADGCYLFRVVMEKVKSRIANHRWEFRLKAMDGEPKTSIVERSNKDARIKALTQLFQQPDGEHDWPEWVKGLLEDQIVIDAATIWVERDSKEVISRLVQVDGSTINRVIDEVGLTPQPPYVAYQQIVKGLPALNFTQEDILYAVSNYRPNHFYGFSDIEQLALLCETQMNRALWTLNHYTEGNIPEVFLMMDSAKYSPEQIREYMGMFESRMNGSSRNRQRVYPLPDGSIHEMRGQELYEAFDEWQARVFCYQLGEPPTALVKAVNRASAQQMDDTREESGEMPRLNWLGSKMNRLVQHPYYFGYDDIEFAWIDQAEVSGLVQAQMDQINVPLGIVTVDEARARDGKAPLTPEQKAELPSMQMQQQNDDDEDDEGSTEKSARGKARRAGFSASSPARLVSMAGGRKTPLRY